MLFGKKGSSSDKGKAAARSAAAQDGDERSPLLGQSSTATAGAGAGSVNNGSTGLRHGRGLLSDDEGSDADDDASDRDSLLEGDDAASDDLLAPGARQRRRRRRARNTYTWRTLVCYTLLALLGIAFITFAILHIWLGRFVSEQFIKNAAVLRERAPDALVYQGPDRVQILHMGANDTTVQLDMRLGVDVRRVFAWNETNLPRVEKKLPFSKLLERKLVAWGVRQVRTASMTLPEPILLSSQEHPHDPMMQFRLQDSLEIPLRFAKADTYDPTDVSWLRNVTLVVPAKILNPRLLANFINSTQSTHEAKVHIKVQKAQVTLGKEDDRGWLARRIREHGGQTIENVEQDVEVECLLIHPIRQSEPIANLHYIVPKGPKLPKEPSKLVDLKSYNLVAVPDQANATNATFGEHLAVYASARVTNPAQELLRNLSLDLSIPYVWPYSIFLHSASNKSELVKLASGVVEPFTISSSSKYFNVSVNATVESTHNATSPLSQSLSKFIRRFLSGDTNRVELAFDSTSPFARSIPSFLVPLLEPLTVSYDIPGLPEDERDLLKDLQISNLRIHGAEDGGSGFQCDGLMQGELAMPEGLDQLDNGINITSFWPDIILYDGYPPANTDDHVPPVPLPANAIARFRTQSWTPAETLKLPETNATVMRAMVRNVPLDIVRRDQLQKWIAKIIFSGGRGALTGIKGITQARATVRGFGEVELHKLPVYGTFYANKPNFMQSALDHFEHLIHP